ncbi:MAG: amino acid permease [Candidatus Krumholzibacteriota bacterium]|nr:amino acid permease [Candidatus Krumholzibacteriota bacterium]
MNTEKRERGITPGISRQIGSFSATNIVVANIIGAGIFTTSGILAGYLPGPLAVLSCWLFGGLIAIAGALCYAELATRMPFEGAEYIYLKTLYHPVLGFLTGWTSLIVGFSAPIAASAIGFSEYTFAGLNGDLISLQPGMLMIAKKAVAVAIIAIFTAIHYTGVRRGSRIQNILTIVKIAIVIGIAVAGLAAGKGAWSNIGFRESVGPWSWPSFGTAMMLVMFAYSGWNASAYIAGELKNPRRTLRVSLISGTGIVIVLYLAINIFLFHTIPYQQIRGTVVAVEQASVIAFGSWMGKGLSLMVGLALLSSLSAFIIIGPRVYFAMARDKLFLPFASKVHPGYGVPGRSIIIQGVIAMVMVSIGSFEQLLVYLGFGLSIFPWLAVAGIFIARKRKTGESTAVKVPWYPFVPLFFLISMLALMAVAFYNRPFESGAAIVSVVAGIPVYFIWVRALGGGKKINENF